MNTYVVLLLMLCMYSQRQLCLCVVNSPSAGSIAIGSSNITGSVYDLVLSQLRGG